jgi:hypothetical protein
MRGLTPRSTTGPTTAGLRAGRAGQAILGPTGPAPCLRGPVSSNVRRRKPHSLMVQQLFQAWLPFLLLLATWLAFGFFVRRKSKDIKTPLTAEIERPRDSVTVARRADSTNILRRYDVFIDGKAVGTVAAGSVAHFPVSAGLHSVAVKVDWCKCADLQIEKRESENLLLWCGACYNDWRCIVMGFLRPKRYVYVRPPTPSDA